MRQVRTHGEGALDPLKDAPMKPNVQTIVAFVATAALGALVWMVLSGSVI